MTKMTGLESIDIALERDGFLRSLIRHLAGALEEVVGIEEASGYISLVGQAVGAEIEALYKDALAVDKLSAEQAAAVMVDLKRRIQGDFFVIEHDDERIVLGNRACPFGDKVIGRPSMCMMTSNVFGHIAAESSGYSKVVLEETIAEGAPGCRVVVHLRQSEAAAHDEGREYFAAVGPRPGRADEGA
jgi:predicted ArsR family transcriptional regulator